MKLFAKSCAAHGECVEEAKVEGPHPSEDGLSLEEGAQQEEAFEGAVPPASSTPTRREESSPGCIGMQVDV